MTNLKLTLLVVLGLALSSAHAANGPNDGGGGKGVVCRNPYNKSIIHSVELLDLWEARVIYKREIPTSAAPVEEQTAAAISRMKNVVSHPYSATVYPNKVIVKGDLVEDTLRRTAMMFYEQENHRWANVDRLRGKRLTSTEDSFEEVVPDDENCTVEQIVRYKDQGPRSGANILINQDLYERMDNTNKAALILHEALYTMLRQFRETNSIRTRRAVGFVMAGNTFKSLDSVVGYPRITCEGYNIEEQSTTRFHFYVTSNSGNKYLALMPEITNQVLSMGFEQGYSGNPITLQQQWKNLASKKGVGIGGGASISNDVDFELQVSYMQIGPNQLSSNLSKTVNGAKVGANTNLTCKFITQK